MPGLVGHWRRKNCRLCSCDYLTKILALTSTPPANAFVPASMLGTKQERFPLDLWMCDACKHVQLLDIVDPSALFSDYVYVSGTSSVFVKHFEDYAARVVLDLDLKPNDLVVDIGSNDGTLLRFFRQHGMAVLGVDPAKEIAARTTASGIETLPEFLSPSLAARIVYEHGPASVVTANNVFAHADDLAGFTESVKAMLAPDGVFVFEVSYLADMYESTTVDLIYHEHVSCHSVSPLVPFFARHGMHLFAVERIATHGGSIRCFVQLKGGSYRLRADVATAIEFENRLDLGDKETWTAFCGEVDHVGISLYRALKALKSEGKTIAGFGAPAKATTLMYHFGLDGSVIDFIVDDSPMKQGLFTPGLHIPVLPSSAITERKPDYLLILAWNFADSIVAKNQEFVNNGGRFIVPLPQLKVIPSDTISAPV